MLPNAETGEYYHSRHWNAVRSFMEHKEVALLDSLLSTRTLNPDKAMFPLHFACAEGDLGTIKKLLEQRSTAVKDRLDINHSFMDLPGGSTALHWAAANQYSMIVGYLVSKGAKVDARTRKGQTALHLACAANHLETIQKLVQSGADPGVLDDAQLDHDERRRTGRDVGKTPLDYVFTDDNDPNDDPIYAYLQSQLSKVSKRNAGKVSNMQHTLQHMEEAADPDAQARSPKASSPKSKANMQLEQSLLHTPSRTEAEVEEAELKALVGRLLAHEVALVVGEGEASEVFRVTRASLMKQRLSRLASTVDRLDLEASNKRERQKIKGVDMEGRIIAEFRHRDAALMPYILASHDKGTSVQLPEDPMQLKALMHEADFFVLPGLEQKCAEALDLLALRKVDPRIRDGRALVHATITQAVAAADEGERIVLAGGVYTESLVFSKSVTLLPEPGAKVCLEGQSGRDCTMTVKHASVMLCDIQITASQARQALPAPDAHAQSEEGKGSSCVLVGDGGLVLMERCSIAAGHASYGIFVHPGGSANLNRVVISASEGTGVSCSSGSITMQHCTVHACKGIGMVVAGTGVASVRRSTISDNGNCGVLIADEGRGIWTGNDVYGNTCAGFAISSSSQECSLRLNNVYQNKQAGLQVFDGGLPRVSASSFYQNEVAGIVCQSGAMARLSSCKVYENLGCGILVDSFSTGQVRQCEVYNNQLAGVAIKEGARPELFDCIIRDGKDAGVLVYASAAPVLHDCQIDGNGSAGVAVSSMAAPHLLRCKLSGNAAGISIVDGGQGVYTDCTLSANGTVQVEVVECPGKSEAPELHRCTVEAGRGCGMVIRGQAACVLVDCQVRKHALMGLVVAGSGANLSMQGGVVEGNETGGLYLSELARVSCVRTSVQENGAVGVLVKRGAIPSFVDCSLSNNQGPGVWFSERGAGSMQGCSIVGNSGAGLLIDTLSNPTIRQCTIKGCRDCGVLSARGGLGTLDGCAIESNKPVGVTVGEKANPVVFQCSLDGNAPYHMLVMDEGLGHLHGNRITNVEVAAVVLGHSARCIIADNLIKLPLKAVKPIKRAQHGSKNLAVENAGQSQGPTQDHGPVAVCWSDNLGQVHGVQPVDVQRLSFGCAHATLATVQERLLDQRPLSQLIASARKQQEEAESVKAAELDAARVSTQETAKSEEAMPSEGSAADDKGQLLDEIISQGASHGNKSDIRTPTPQLPEDEVVGSNKAAVAVIKSNTFMPAAHVQKQLDHLTKATHRGKRKPLGGYFFMTRAASERETRHVAPLAETIASEAQSKDGKEGGKQEAEGMGAPFGLAL